MIWFMVTFGFVFGAFVGSYLNVCAHRLPRGESVVTPRSRCYRCGTMVMGYDNIPIISWLLLKGRCRWCGAPFSIRYLLVEIVVGLLTAGAVWWIFHPQSQAALLVASLGPLAGWGELTPVWFNLIKGAALGALLVMVYCLVVGALIDLDHQVLPDELNVPLWVLAPFFALLMDSAYQAMPLNALFAVDEATRTMNQLPGAWNQIIFWGLLGLLLCALAIPLGRWTYGHWLRGEHRWPAEEVRGFTRFSLAFLLALTPALLVWGLLWASGDTFPVPSQDALPAVLRHSGTLAALTTSLLGALAGWLLLTIIGLGATILLRRNAMGFGDVKLMGWVGALVGPLGVLYVFAIASIVGALIGGTARALGGSREIPFGPYLMIGALVVAVVGPEVHDLVLSRIGITGAMPGP